MKRLYAYEELSDRAKKATVIEIERLEGSDLVDWELVYEDMHEHIRYLCEKRGYKAENNYIEDHYGRGLSRESMIQWNDMEKAAGMRMVHLYHYLDEMSDGYLEIDINVESKDPVDISFEYSAYKDCEEMMEYNKRHHKRVGLEHYKKYSFYSLIASEEEVEEKYKEEIESDFETIGEYFSGILKEKLTASVEELVSKVNQFIRGTFDYYESDEHIVYCLEDKGSWLEEQYKFLLDGTPVKDGEEGKLECSNCYCDSAYEEIHSTEKEGKSYVVCEDCKSEEIMKRVV